MNAEHRKLRPGSILYMPRITPDRIKKDLAMPYYQFANKIVGRLNPQAGIPLPKVHHPNFFGQFVKLLAWRLCGSCALSRRYYARFSGYTALRCISRDAGLGDAAIQGLWRSSSACRKSFLLQRSLRLACLLVWYQRAQQKVLRH